MVISNVIRVDKSNCFRIVLSPYTQQSCTQSTLMEARAVFVESALSQKTESIVKFISHQSIKAVIALKAA